MTGREKFNKYKGIINLLVLFFKFFGRKSNLLLLNFFRNTNGNIALVLRYVFIKNIAKKVGDNVSIQPGVFLFNLQNIEIGDNVSVHPMCYIEGAGGLKIGNNVSIAHASTLISTNHTWNDVNLPIKYNKEEKAEIEIQDDVWIGCGVRILAGVKIKKRSIVAAGAVVTKTFDSNSILGGVPAKLLKKINV